MPTKILYIDEDDRLPKEVGPTLQRAGFDVLHARGPAEALRYARAESPAIVLVEVLMSGHDGYTLVEELMAEAAPRPLPVIVVTRGDRTPELYGRGLELGVEEFLFKPVTRAQILEAVLDCARYLEGEDPSPEAQIPMQPSFSGDLGDELLPGLLGRLNRAGASGALALRNGAETGSLELRNGTPVRVSIEQAAESFAAYLRKTDRLDSEQYEMLLDHLMAKLAGPREILLGMGALSEAELETAAEEQALGIVELMCGWTRGSFELNVGTSLDRSDSLELTSRLDDIISNGTQRLDLTAIDRVLLAQSQRYVFVATDHSDRGAGVGLTTDQRAALFELTGERTLSEVRDTTALDAASLYRLFASGRIEFDDAPMLILDEEIKPIEPEEQFPEVDPENALMGPDLSRQRLPKRHVVNDGTTESSIRGIAEQLEARNDFALFEIDETSSSSDVRAAHDRLRGFLLVDRIPKELDDLRALARKLLPKLDQAYGRVKNADARAAFAGLQRRSTQTVEKPKAEEPTTAERAREAESWFRTGKGHLDHDEFEQAVEAFGMAAHRDPSQGDYHAHLGYALYRSNPGQQILRREALEHVAKGIKLSPGSEKPLLFLGRIFRESGETAMAAKVLRRALKLSPDSPALVQEMCLIDGTTKSSNRGFLARFRKR